MGSNSFGLKDKDLKKMLGVARKEPLGFAYCPGKTADSDVLGLHRRLDGQTLGQKVRAEGEGQKVAFGTADVSGKLLTLTCTRALCPGLPNG